MIWHLLGTVRLNVVLRETFGLLSSLIACLGQLWYQGRGLSFVDRDSHLLMSAIQQVSPWTQLLELFDRGKLKVVAEICPRVVEGGTGLVVVDLVQQASKVEVLGSAERLVYKVPALVPWDCLIRIRRMQADV